MLKPFLMGGAMAAMMLWMGHERIMAGDADLTGGAVLFLLAHVALVAIAFALALLLPKARQRLRAHRPSTGHVLGMVAGMLVAGSLLHGLVHGIML